MSEKSAVESRAVLETGRLFLIRLSTDDAAFIQELVNDPEWIRYIGDRGVRTLEDAAEYIRKGPLAMYETYGYGLYLVREKGSGDAVGICGLLKRDFLEHADLGFALLARYRGKGYASEAARAVVAYAGQTLGLAHLEAITNPDNGSSIGILEKLGFRFERMIAYPGETAPLRLFSINVSGRAVSPPGAASAQ
jgi:RimJ/RimL family protein N-acetyltransferase